MSSPEAKRVRRLAMWSGPRNISTAMMRAWENRPDCQVFDEPFYAWWLKETGEDHPMRNTVLSHHESDAARVIAALEADPPASTTLLYAKMMTHHMLEGQALAWMAEWDHVFLVRDPARMLASYAKKRPGITITPEDLGLPQQVRLFDEITALTGQRPPVLDADEVLSDPRTILKDLCTRLKLPFFEEMLLWPAGRRDSDGIWAAHWYDAVEKSTGFAPAPDTPPEIAAPAPMQSAYRHMRAKAHS